MKPTQLHRPAIFFRSFKDPSSQRAKPFRKLKIALTSRSCRYSCGPLRSCYLPGRFWNSCSTLRSKIFCTAGFRAAITLEGSEVRPCVLAATRDHQTGVSKCWHGGEVSMMGWNDPIATAPNEKVRWRRATLVLRGDTWKLLEYCQDATLLGNMEEEILNPASVIFVAYHFS